jgi:hypothetical protein
MDITIGVIDPGNTTGYLVARAVHNHSPKPHHRCLSIIKYGEWTDLTSYLHTDILAALCSSETLVVEDYRIYPHKAQAHIGSRPYAIEVIGHIQLLAHQHEPAIPVHFQMASQAKGQWPEKRLRRHYDQDTLRVLGSRHCKDCLRHLLTYLENKTEWGMIIREEDAI